MMKLLRGSLLILFVAGTTTLWAQGIVSTKNKKAIDAYVQADNYRVRGQYREAIELLKFAIEKDNQFFEAYLRLGITYKAMKDYVQATAVLEQGLPVTPETRWQKVFWVELAEISMKLGDYKRVSFYSEQYLANESINKAKIDQATLWKKSAEFSLKNMNTNIKFEVHELSDTLNRYVMQYFPVVTGDQQEMIFTRRTGLRDENDEDLVISRKSASGTWQAPESVSPNINSEFNEGTCTVSADGRQLIFTSCQGRKGFGDCDLFESVKTGDEWSVPVNLGAMINSAAWDSQPSLSADGRVLYFVSDRRGGIGGWDIYVSSKSDDGKWSKARNMGRTINSAYHEISPFIHANGRTLFFATTGRPGFGGYDIFRSEKEDSVWTEPVNFGYPINNQDDQFSMFITADGERGYYSHEETGAIKSSKIFEFFVPEEYRVKYRSNVVKGVVRDRKTHEPVRGRIELFNLLSNEIVSVTNSDSVSGQYLMVLTQGADYALYANAQGYLFRSLNFNYEHNYDPKPVVIDIDLDKAGAGAVIVLNNIFFEIDKYDLEPKSKTELDKVARFLLNNPGIRVEISGHTDDTGTVSHNQTLSLKRAQAVVDYLVGHSVPRNRLVGTGYGSTRPLKPNDSEENRQVNRRIEFKLL
jgi:OOP family OmpA-OmpF porin